MPPLGIQKLTRKYSGFSSSAQKTEFEAGFVRKLRI